MDVPDEGASFLHLLIESTRKVAELSERSEESLAGGSSVISISKFPGALSVPELEC